MEDLSEWLMGNSTPPEVWMAILQGLNQWRSDETGGTTAPPSWVRDLIKKQSTCGWQNFF
jgi:hypothetical protein